MTRKSRDQIAIFSRRSSIPQRDWCRFTAVSEIIEIISLMQQQFGDVAGVNGNDDAEPMTSQKTLRSGYALRCIGPKSKDSNVYVCTPTLLWQLTSFNVWHLRQLRPYDDIAFHFFRESDVAYPDVASSRIVMTGTFMSLAAVRKDRVSGCDSCLIDERKKVKWRKEKKVSFNASPQIEAGWLTFRDLVRPSLTRSASTELVMRAYEWSWPASGQNRCLIRSNLSFAVHKKNHQWNTKLPVATNTEMPCLSWTQNRNLLCVFLSWIIPVGNSCENVFLRI